MSKPETVRILNLGFRIEWVEGPRAKLMEHSGEIFFEEQVILINTARSLQWQADTLLHEIIHALTYAMGFEEIKGGAVEEEDFVARISTCLCTVWLNNPEVMSWIHCSIVSPHPPKEPGIKIKFQ